MRHRRWVVVLAVLVIAVLPLSFIGLRVASRRPSVKRALLSRIVPEVEGPLSIGELEIGLASLRLGDVTVKVGETALIEVPEASVSVSYKRLLTNGFELRRALSTVIVNDPTVTITYGRGAAPDSVERALDLAALAAYLPEYLGVSGATLVLEDAAASRSARIDSIALILAKVGEGQIEGNAVGGGFGRARNVRSELVWDEERGAVDVTADLSEAYFEEGLRLPGAIPVDATAGRARASLTLSASDAGVDRFVVTYAVEDGRVDLPAGLGVLEGASVEGSYDGSRAAISVDGARWHGASVSAEGAIDLRGGSFDALVVTGRAVPAGRLAEVFGTGPTEVGGPIDFEAVIGGRLDAPRLSATARARELEIAGITFTDVRADGGYSGDDVALESFAATALGGRFEGDGTAVIGRAGAPWILNVRCVAEGLAAQAVSDLLGGPEARGAIALSGVEIGGTSERPELEAIVRWSDAGVGPVDLRTGAGGVFLRDGTLYLTAAAIDSSFTALAEVAGFFSDDPFIDADLRLIDVSADSLLALDGAPRIPVLLDGSIDVAGRPDDLGVSGRVAARGRVFSATLGLIGGLTGGPDGARLSLAIDSDDAAVRGVATPFSSLLEIDRSELSVGSLEIAGVARGHLRLGLGAERPLEAGLVVSEAALGDVLRAVTGYAPTDADGLVFASASATGTLERPSATLQLQIGSGRLAGVGRLDAALLAVLAGRRVEVRECTVREGGRAFVEASGEVDLDGDIALSVRGDGIPGPLLGGGDDSRFDLTLGLGGGTTSPTLDGRLESSDGTFLRIPYDDLVARVTGAEGILRVEPLALEKEGSYRLSASARVPYGAIAGREGQEGTLSVEVDGDPLAFLSELYPFVERAHGSGRLDFRLVGGRREVTLVSADLQARASRVEPSLLFEELTDVEAAVTIEDGAVREGSITALVDGDPIALTSTRDAPRAERPPAPLSIAGVDVGLLALSTGPEGVRTTVPGLMLPEDVGRVAVRGKGREPSFLVSGPAERPFLWGELEFSDMTFTYPFADSDGDAMGGFLADAEWSVSIVAGRNVWYWRPDANLRLETGGALDFAGIPSEGGLCVSGRIESVKGTVTYLDTDFDVEEVFVDFPPLCEPPRFYVEATTRVEDGTTVTLTMDAFERALAFAARGATIDESALTLSSDSPDDATQEAIASRLTYGSSPDLTEGEGEELGRRRAIEVIATQLSGRVVRPLLSPIEGRLKRNLNLDLVRFEVDFVEHFLAQLDQWSAQEDGGEYQPFLADTRVTLGKYISRDWLLSYVGIAEAFEEEIGEQQLGLRHELGIEYEVSRNTSLSLRTVYDPSLAGWDRRISIENRYEF
jgi:hypothetical protein